MMGHDKESHISLGDDCYIDLDGAVLIKDGEVRYLTPIAFHLFRFLAEHIGEVVSSDDLFRRGWGKETMAQRDELYVFIRQIRIQLEDDPNDPMCLKTLRRRGYVLLARKKHGSGCTV